MLAEIQLVFIVGCELKYVDKNKTIRSQTTNTLLVQATVFTPSVQNYVNIQ